MDAYTINEHDFKWKIDMQIYKINELMIEKRIVADKKKEILNLKSIVSTYSNTVLWRWMTL